MAAARASKARNREEGPAPDYPTTVPELRRSIIIIDRDFGTVEHRIDMYRTNRIDFFV